MKVLKQWYDIDGKFKRHAQVVAAKLTKLLLFLYQLISFMFQFIIHFVRYFPTSFSPLSLTVVEKLTILIPQQQHARFSED